MTGKIQLTGMVPAVGSGQGAVKAASPQAADFERVLSEQKIKFSLHARERLSEQKINLTGQDASNISKAVDKAALKGSRETLLMMKDCAFIVNIPNRTVITAVDENRMKENIFTNIDSAVVL